MQAGARSWWITAIRDAEVVPGHYCHHNIPFKREKRFKFVAGDKKWEDVYFSVHTDYMDGSVIGRTIHTSRQSKYAIEAEKRTRDTVVHHVTTATTFSASGSRILVNDPHPRTASWHRLVIGSLANPTGDLSH